MVAGAGAGGKRRRRPRCIPGRLVLVDYPGVALTPYPNRRRVNPAPGLGWLAPRSANPRQPKPCVLPAGPDTPTTGPNLTEWRGRFREGAGSCHPVEVPDGHGTTSTQVLEVLVDQSGDQSLIQSVKPTISKVRPTLVRVLVRANCFWSTAIFFRALTRALIPELSVNVRFNRSTTTFEPTSPSRQSVRTGALAISSSPVSSTTCQSAAWRTLKVKGSEVISSFH